MRPPKSMSLALLVFPLLVTWCRDICQADESTEKPMQIRIDTREMNRKLLKADLSIPLDQSDSERSISLWYPKWVPGSHGPGGPVANIGGLQIHSDDGRLLQWQRAPGEVYRLSVEVPEGVSALRVSVAYITDQPTTTSFGHDCFSSDHLAVISPGCLLLYPESSDIDKKKIQAELQLPQGWHAATALPAVGETQSADKTLDSEGTQSYSTVNLRTFVDSPIMIGPHYKAVQLAENSEIAPPHTLHIFADSPEQATLPDDVLKNYQAMVTQTASLIGSHPFDRFDILLGITSSLPKNGLEHARSTMNILPPASLKSASALKGWDRLLVPHEYLHAWCGKYRRPAGMLTSDFHSAKDTELLWVYEGLTQYLGELVEARSGLMSEEEFRNRLLVELRNAMHQQGRRWRSLSDTAAASHLLRAASPYWSGLRRSQDYYMEGMLFWIEADARIRQITDGEKSLDDFCKSLFEASRDTVRPNPYDRQEIVEQLEALADFDWDGLIKRRVESVQDHFDPAVAELLGYHFHLTPRAPKIPANTFRASRGIDLLDSLGMSVSAAGEVQKILLDSPADDARMAQRQKIIGVAGFLWNGERLKEAVRDSSTQKHIDLLIVEGERLVPRQIHYSEGLPYWNLKRDESQPDRLAEILKTQEP